MQKEIYDHTVSQISEFERCHQFKETDYYKSLPPVDQRLNSIKTLKSSRLDSQTKVFDDEEKSRMLNQTKSMISTYRDFNYYKDKAKIDELKGRKSTFEERYNEILNTDS